MIPSRLGIRRARRKKPGVLVLTVERADRSGK
jgi:hypothetical protein